DCNAGMWHNGSAWTMNFRPCAGRAACAAWTACAVPRTRYLGDSVKVSFERDQNRVHLIRVHRYIVNIQFPTGRSDQEQKGVSDAGTGETHEAAASHL